MKKSLLIITFLLSLISLKAQESAKDGQVFYEDNKTIKEAFQYIYQYSYYVNPKTGVPTLSPNPVIVKHGGYILYRKDGSIEQTGQYDNNNKVGEWKTYDTKGKVIKKEQF